MPEVELLFMLMVAVTILVLIARRLNQPYPILLVLGGLILGFTPGIPRVNLHSEVVLLVFLPPLLFVDATHTSWRDFRNEAVPILRLAIVLVVITAAAVAIVAHALIPDLTWPIAFVLGAVVAPTDPVATEAIAQRLHLPRRILTILKGESLINDASAIVIFRIALAVAQGSLFSPGRALGSFALVSLGGIAVGLAVAWIVSRIQKALPEDPAIETTVSLLTPFAAYMPAEFLHVSGVLAVVAGGMYLGWLNPHLVSSRTRLQAAAVWQMLAFLLNGLLFLLVGMQLRRIVEHLPSERSLTELLWSATLVSLTVMVVRIVWVYIATFVPRLFVHTILPSNPLPTWRQVAIVAWSGMRGGISLAVALSIPQTLGSAADATGKVPFPARDELLFVTFGVILFTLIAQGLSLPALIRSLGVVRGPEEADEETRTRLHAYSTVLDHWQQRADDTTISPTLYRELQRLYTVRHKHLAAATQSAANDATSETPAEDLPGTEEYVRLRRELLAVERQAVLDLRDREEIGDETLRHIQKDQDLDEIRLDSLRSLG